MTKHNHRVGLHRGVDHAAGTGVAAHADPRTGRREVRVFFFKSRRRHTGCSRDWIPDVCSSDLVYGLPANPQLPSNRLKKSGAFSVATAAVLGVLALVGIRKRRMDEKEGVMHV